MENFGEFPHSQLSYAKQKRKKDMFNRISGTYDILNALLSFGIDRYWRKRTIRELRLDEKSIVLDIATGTGEMAREALKYSEARIIGIDPAGAMLQKTRKKLAVNHNRFNALEAYGEQIPLDKEKFTHVMVGFGIRNFTDRALGYKEIYRVLQPQGMFAVLEFSRPRFSLFKQIYFWYSYYIVTKFGGWFSGDKEAYTYLPDSVSHFPNEDEFVSECAKAGFVTRKVNPMFFGIVTLYIFQK